MKFSAGVDDWTLQGSSSTWIVRAWTPGGERRKRTAGSRKPVVKRTCIFIPPFYHRALPVSSPSCSLSPSFSSSPPPFPFPFSLFVSLSLSCAFSLLSRVGSLVDDRRIAPHRVVSCFVSEPEVKTRRPPEPRLLEPRGREKRPPPVTVTCALLQCCAPLSSPWLYARVACCCAPAVLPVLA